MERWIGPTLFILLTIFMIGWGRSVFSAPAARNSQTKFVWAEPTRYLRLEAAYTFHSMNYTGSGSSEYQRFFYGDFNRYELRFGIGYLNKFSDQAYQFGVGGTYHLLKPLAVSLDVAVSPNQMIQPVEELQTGVRYSFLKGWLKVGGDFRFQGFRQADLYEGVPVVQFGMPERFWFTGRYILTRTADFLGNTRGEQSFEIRGDLRPFSVLTLSGFYGRSQHDFEAGAPDNPFKQFTADELGGGVRFTFSGGSGLFFDFRGQDRNNAQTSHLYTGGMFIQFR